MEKVYLIMLFLLSFSIVSSCQSDFDKKVWLKNNKFSTTENPRRYMIDDLIQNHLKKGMSKDSILFILGKPYKDTIELYIPKDLTLPDSLQFSNRKQLIEKEKRIEYINKWYDNNYKSAPFLSYIIGWSLIDPVFLEIMLDEDNKVVNFEVMEH